MGEPQATPSAAFGRLHPGVQRWIWRQGWTELRDVQEQAISHLLEHERDLVIAAATASGKTEAAFLPIVSRVANRAEDAPDGFDALYVSPLRALINDQFGRVEGLCEELAIPVFKWHGDVAQSLKDRARRVRRGIVLITPESLEAILIRRGSEATGLFRALSHVVVDELHAFFDVPRGKQLQSLLARIEACAGHRVTRIGLSATLADLTAAAGFLRPGQPEQVEVLLSAASQLRLKLQLRGHHEPPPPPPRVPEEATAEAQIARHLHATLRGTKSLVFAGSRRTVESLSAQLADLAEVEGVPNEFLPHHGSLSREWREAAEARMKDPGQPSTAVCTTTLELGIDIGAIQSVAQIGPGHSVAGMRQRLGRSGRRPGQPAVMRIYVAEESLHSRTHPLDALRARTLQTIAMVELLLQRWIEPPLPQALHLSTLLHQILALIGQYGGITPRRAYQTLVPQGAFAGVSPELFKALLRRMAEPETGLLEQAPDGTLLPGPEGERLLGSFSFFAVFATKEEYRLVHDGKLLGQLPIEPGYAPGQYLVFAGRRWLISSIDPHRREMLLEPARAGKVPRFGGEGVAPHEAVVAEMRRLYEAEILPIYLNEGARTLLTEGRTSYARMKLAQAQLVEHGNEVLLFPWVGGRRQLALSLALTRAGIPTALAELALVAIASVAKVRAALVALATAEAPDSVTLAGLVEDKQLDKFDSYLGTELQGQVFASRMLDTRDLPALAGELARSSA